MTTTERGVEFRAELEDGTTVTIVTLEQAERRLLRSALYRKWLEWDNLDYSRCFSPRKLRPAECADLFLTQIEQAKLDGLRGVKSAAWYEIWRLPTLYGI